MPDLNYRLHAAFFSVQPRPPARAKKRRTRFLGEPFATPQQTKCLFSAKLNPSLRRILLGMRELNGELYNTRVYRGILRAQTENIEQPLGAVPEHRLPATSDGALHIVQSVINEHQV